MKHDLTQYEKRTCKSMRSCVGCIAMPEIKRAVAAGSNIEATLCHQLGKDCLREQIVWVQRKTQKQLKATVKDSLTARIKPLDKNNG